MRLVAFTLSVLILATAGVSRAQEWNSERVLQRIDQAAARRLLPLEDSSLTSYTARADGFVYFFLDREDGGDPIPMMVDQVSLDLYWEYPDRSRQVIRAMRRRRLLPTVREFRYYRDRVSVVLDGYGDEIRTGEGRDVRGVPHPLAPDSRRFYNYRIRDSLVVEPLGSSPVEVDIIEVRPRDPGDPAFLGDVYVDRATGAVARLDFTFTPASYVDPRIDYVAVRIEYGLWDGRFWFPREQRLTVRREIPELDLPVGTIIRSAIEISDYEFNHAFPSGFFAGPRLLYPPRSGGDSSRFDEGLLSRLADEGLSPPVRPIDLRAEAERMVRQRYAREGGLPAARLSIPAVSEILRYNRAEGVRLGAATSVRRRGTRVRLRAGYAFAAQRPQGLARLGRDLGGPVLEADLYGNWPGELRGFTSVAGIVNSLGTLFAGDDFMDPYFRHGGRIGLRGALGGSIWRVDARMERHVTAQREVRRSPVGGASLREVRRVQPGVMAAAEIGLDAPIRLGSWNGSWQPRVRLGTLDQTQFAAYEARAEIGGWFSGFTRSVRIEAAGGMTTRGAPPQEQFLVGGRGTVPGQPYRAYAGRFAGYAAVEASQEILPGWLTLRAFAGGGGSAMSDDVPGDWMAGSSGGLRGGIGAGIGFLYDLVRLDLARGVRGGGTTVFLAVNPALRARF